ncbi:hypothetical protein TRAPUB_5857 [Trametes pubescens]|uniref:Uncharacterized protein n=1 Tax=Trametes pubescens TaxID=154538 RepID=A0A1M2V761_TRAPU|nr:hypothetical protein TRAPUB_5857 [Trametes pubescens]
MLSVGISSSCPTAQIAPAWSRCVHIVRQTKEEQTHREVDNIEHIERANVKRSAPVCERKRALRRCCQLYQVNGQPADKALRHREPRRRVLLRDARGEGVACVAGKDVNPNPSQVKPDDTPGVGSMAFGTFRTNDALSSWM